MRAKREPKVRDVLPGKSCDGEMQEISTAWASNWPGAEPGEILREKFPDRWVRFHSLPDAQRYAQSEDDYDVLLARHHAVLRDLPGFDEFGEVLTVSFSGSLASSPVERTALLATLLPGAAYWRSVAIGNIREGFYWVHAYISRFTPRADVLDPLLLEVSDDRVGDVMIAPKGFEWIYSPYDGGADVFLPSMQERDQLAQAHADWLSPYTSGL